MFPDLGKLLPLVLLIRFKINMSVQQWQINIHMGKIVVLRDTPVGLPICTPQILHILNRLQTFASGPSGRHL